MEFKDKLKSKRQELGMTLDDVAKKVGVSTPTLSRYESGEIQNVRRDKISKLASALNVTPAYLMGWEEVEHYDNIFQIKTRKIPFLGDIACGEPLFCQEEKAFIAIDEELHADFCLRAKGDSMIGARIHDGDLVFAREQSIVENGEIAVVIIDNEATLKRVFYYKDENMISLNAENSAYRPLIYTQDELEGIRILGKAVAFQSKV